MSVFIHTDDLKVKTYGYSLMPVPVSFPYVDRRWEAQYAGYNIKYNRLMDFHFHSLSGFQSLNDYSENDIVLKKLGSN